MKDGWDGKWTTWLTATVPTTHTVSPAQDGHTYFFRARARDLAGNQSAYDDQSVGRYVYLGAADACADPRTSFKGVDSPLESLINQSAGTIDLWNTGNLSTTATLTDTLPP